MRPQFGNRFLTTDKDVFEHNAWDNVEWDEEQEAIARESVQKNSAEKMHGNDVKKYEEEADKFWDSFYSVHSNKFFKDRHWLFTEFPELAPSAVPEGSAGENSRRIFEIGCGVGNTIIPILKYSQEKDLMIYGADFSAKAVEILQEDPHFDKKRSQVFVLDATAEIWDVPFTENSLDIIVLIFVLSAINPTRMSHVAHQVAKYLKPGGLVVFRDYGLYDMAQLRFKPGKCLEENFYVRGDGTRVFFFTQQDVRELFEKAGLVEEQNHIDRRLQVNRGRQLKMYRFGNRFLTTDKDVFEHNAWDNVEWDEEQEAIARESVQKNSAEKMHRNDVKKYEEEADKFWDSFYSVHSNKFFKDRHWLFTEFPELAPSAVPEGSAGENSRRIFEIGCGVGNTIIPILKYSQEKDLMIYGADFSAKAVEILQEDPHFDKKRSQVFVLDATAEIWDVPFSENSLDIIVLIFVLSAINPTRMPHVTQQVAKYLKPGGLVVFRDYGLYDMAQLRFKPGKCLEENFYVRGDGTRVFFFTQQDVRELFEKAGLVEEQNHIDRRLQVNRGRQLKMYRVWIQA
uniref:Methyltransferase-like protein n=1 Tax=Lutzomyia longipalpis TaxID=7200 RepID=A0A1B0CCR0_LUTLO